MSAFQLRLSAGRLARDPELFVRRLLTDAISVSRMSDLAVWHLSWSGVWAQGWGWDLAERSEADADAKKLRQALAREVARVVGLDCPS